MVSMPLASYPVAALVIAEDVNWMVGYLSASNHFSLFAWVFFIPLPVFIVATSRVASNVDVVRSFGSKFMVPFKPPNWPAGSPPSNFTKELSAIFHSCDLNTANEDARIRTTAATGYMNFFITIILFDKFYKR